MADYADYKELYLKMVRASEEAIRLLIKAQRECEELYLSSSESSGKGGIILLDGTEEDSASSKTRFPEIH